MVVSASNDGTLRSAEAFRARTIRGHRVTHFAIVICVAVIAEAVVIANNAGIFRRAVTCLARSRRDSVVRAVVIVGAVAIATNAGTLQRAATCLTCSRRDGGTTISQPLFLMPSSSKRWSSQVTPVQKSCDASSASLGPVDCYAEPCCAPAGPMGAWPRVARSEKSGFIWSS